VTSPPYFGLRDYGHVGQIGLEDTPAAFVAQMVEVFREVRRVLRDDGTLWLNLGDSYASSPPGNTTKGVSSKSGLNGVNGASGKYRETLEAGHATKRDTSRLPGLKPKDLIGIPWRVAFALQADGWYLRQDIIWAKPNPMPESVQDRCTKAHEYLFLLSKGPRYHFDAEAIASLSAPPAWRG
jgi:DNA modification methylase